MCWDFFSGSEAHSAHHQVSLDRPQSGVCVERGGRKAAARALRRLLHQSQNFHRDPRQAEDWHRRVDVVVGRRDDGGQEVLRRFDVGRRQEGDGQERKEFERQKENSETTVKCERTRYSVSFSC